MNDSTKVIQKAIDPENWVEAYGESLLKYALFRLQDVDLAEEKIQETFLAALQSRHRFQGRSTEKVWLISILKRKIYDHFRQKYRCGHFRGIFLTEDITYDVPGCRKIKAISLNGGFSDPQTACEQKEFLEKLQHALSRLPKRLATVFILRDVIEMSSVEICNLMNISMCNLYVMTHRARRRLKRILEFDWA